ncbi:1-phosphatidylinositol phosphodiesterase [Ceratocystis platani]|uniref:1-phosphatidylinositol phosphodiesterase n=1 Tax=Ceratocystis fimbriata f. sp. platani TaxID=88771 RepID=A0A0F8B5V2_CERFI|nr:1-phosphatidylinositol phosphodiesterase [Ceratocystis platani]
MRFSAVFTALASVALCHAGTFNGFTDAWSFDLADTQNPDWMSSLADNIPLSMLSIPGTHNSMTHKLKDDDLQGQNTPLDTQLNAGIRYFDISVRCMITDIWVYHGGTFTSYNIEQVLSTLFDFLDNHPKETVILRIRKGSLLDSQENFLHFLTKHLVPGTPLGDRAVARVFSKGTDGITAVPTLGEVRGKVFILQDFKTNIPGRYGLPWDSPAISSYNFKVTLGTILIKLKWRAVQAFIEAIPSTSREMLSITHTTVSAGAKPIEIAASHGRVEGLNKRLGDYLWNKNRMPASVPSTNRIGVVAMDFPGQFLVEYIIKLNNIHQVSSPPLAGVAPGIRM